MLAFEVSWGVFPPLHFSRRVCLELVFLECAVELTSRAVRACGEKMVKFKFNPTDKTQVCQGVCFFLMEFHALPQLLFGWLVGFA